MIQVETMESIPANSNPFHSDAYHMGQYIAKNVCVMYATHEHETATYIVVVNRFTGERVRVSFGHEEHSGIARDCCDLSLHGNVPMFHA